LLTSFHRSLSLAASVRRRLCAVVNMRCGVRFIDESLLARQTDHIAIDERNAEEGGARARWDRTGEGRRRGEKRRGENDGMRE
jgi:hypothetical protein